MPDLDAVLADIARITTPLVTRYRPDLPLTDPAIVVGCPCRPDPPPFVLWLDNKGASVDCVARLVATLPDETVAHWLAATPGPTSPQAVLDRVTLLVEDASADSVFGTLLLLLRIAGVQPGEQLPEWLASVALWETSGVAVGDPWHAWPVLVSALTHAEYGNAARPTDAEYATAWTKALRFAAECLRSGRPPTDLATVPGSALHQEALAALRQEEQTYHDWLSHAQVVQLSLPLRRGNHRRMLVDALLFKEDQPTGAAKALYRNDRTRSPLGEGFCFAASLRPGAAPGSGNDLTITVDPRRGVSLHELREELERRQTAAWVAQGRQRPDWAPRADMQARFGTPWNQPWYADEEDTLLAAPRDVWDDRVTPSVRVDSPFLTWPDVLAAIWAVYNPLRGVMVTPARGGAPIPLLLVPEVANTADGKHLVMARWLPAAQQPAGAMRSLGTAPVVDRVLAGLIGHGPAQTVSLDALPAPGSWTRVTLSGGFAIATRRGLLVLDDWQDTLPLDLAAIEHVFTAATRLDTALARLEREQLGPLIVAMAEETARTTPREPPGLVSRAARVQVALAGLRGSAAAIPADADARAVRQALDQVWALDTRLTGQEQRTKAIADSLKALGDARVRRLTQFVAVVGFPFYFASGLAAQLARLFIAFGWAPTPTSGTDPSAVEWWIAFVLLFLPGVGLATAVSRHQVAGRGDQVAEGQGGA